MKLAAGMLNLDIDNVAQRRRTPVYDLMSSPKVHVPGLAAAYYGVKIEFRRAELAWRSDACRSSASTWKI